MKTYQLSIDTIETPDDTMEAEDADPGYNEPVVFNQTANQSYSQGVHGANDYKFSSDKDGISDM